MAIDDILEGLLSRPLEKSSDAKRMETSVGIPEENDTYDVSLHNLVLALEQVCEEKYKDPGRGLHFFGLLFAVFAAEVLSAYWQKTGQIDGGRAVTGNRGSAWMVSCLYSKGTVAFVLSHPLEVIL